LHASIQPGYVPPGPAPDLPGLLGAAPSDLGTYGGAQGPIDQQVPGPPPNKVM